MLFSYKLKGIETTRTKINHVSTTVVCHMTKNLLEPNRGPEASRMGPPGRSESATRSLKDLEISPRAGFRVSHLQLQGDYEKKRNGGQRKLRKRDAGNCSRSH